MAKFNVGDRVLVRKGFSPFYEGFEGVIVQVGHPFEYELTVNIPERENGLGFDAYELELIEPEGKA